MESASKRPYRGEAFYDLKIEGLERRLPVVEVEKGLRIASFVMLGDVKLIEHCAGLLAGRIKEGFDVIAAPEAKAIALAHTLARVTGGASHKMDYCIIRKSKKAYSTGGVSSSVKSITTRQVQELYLDETDVRKINGKRVCLVDDVVSTGGTISACAELISLSGGMVHQIAAVLFEGEADERRINAYAENPAVHLARIPLFYGE